VTTVTEHAFERALSVAGLGRLVYDDDDSYGLFLLEDSPWVATCWCGWRGRKHHDTEKGAERHSRLHASRDFDDPDQLLRIRQFSGIPWFHLAGEPIRIPEDLDLRINGRWLPIQMKWNGKPTTAPTRRCISKAALVALHG
jgi:hypothetical protein